MGGVKHGDGGRLTLGKGDGLLWPICVGWRDGSGFRVGWRTAVGGGALVSVSGFRGFSASVGKAFILAGGGALGYHSVEFRH